MSLDSRYPHQIYIDSDYRVSGTTSNFKYKLNAQTRSFYDMVCLKRAVIPKTMYLVNSTNNTLQVDENGSVTTIDMPIGNYSPNSFLTELKNQLNANCDYTYDIEFTDVDVGAQRSLGKFNYSVTGNGGIQPIFTFPQNSVMYLPMGFNKASTVQFAADALQSSDVIQLTPTTILVKSDICSTISGELGGNILAMIPSNTTNNFSAISYEAQDAYYSSKQLLKNPADYNLVHFYITDQDDNVLDLNGRGLNLELVFFKRDDLTEMMRDYVKFRVHTLVANHVKKS